jgi:hypothetical protein
VFSPFDDLYLHLRLAELLKARAAGARLAQALGPPEALPARPAPGRPLRARILEALQVAFACGAVAEGITPPAPPLAARELGD